MGSIPSSYPLPRACPTSFSCFSFRPLVRRPLLSCLIIFLFWPCAPHASLILSSLALSLLMSLLPTPFVYRPPIWSLTRSWLVRSRYKFPTHSSSYVLHAEMLGAHLITPGMQLMLVLVLSLWCIAVSSKTLSESPSGAAVTMLTALLVPPMVAF